MNYHFVGGIFGVWAAHIAGKLTNFKVNHLSPRSPAAVESDRCFGWTSARDTGDVEAQLKALENC